MSRIFSEHWHRVAGLRLELRPMVLTRQQVFRGEKWYVVIDPLNNQFFRITEQAHAFLARLSSRATVQEVWQRCLEGDPDGAPGQEEVVQMLAQLHEANLLRGELAPDTSRLLDRFSKRERQEWKSWFSVTLLRFPLFDPDRLLVRLLPFLRWLISPLGAVLWLLVVGAAVKIGIDHAEQLRSQSEALLAPANLPALFAGTILIKVLHEFGHAFACRRFGGEVHVMGIMLMYLTPVPYVDATASWAFRSKWERIFVAAAGMIVEFFVAALAMFCWAGTGEGVIHSVAFNMIWIASVTTLLFNANPLLRYDGYYLLADLLEMPNLQSRSMLMLRHLAERHLFGVRASLSPAHTRGEAIFFTVYGLASWIYRIVVFVGIAMFIGTRYFLLGTLIALGCVYSYTVKPLWSFGHYLASSPRLSRVRRRAVLVSAGITAVLLAVLAWWPAPNRFRAPGILRAERYSEVFTGTPGTVAEVLAASGSLVRSGQPLVRLTSRELELELTAARAELARATAEEERAMNRNAAELAPIQSRRAVAEKRLKRIQEQELGLVVTAPQDGTWVSPQIDDRRGQWIARGQLLGQMIDDQEFRFSAVISQDEAANLFSGEMNLSEVRLIGQADAALRVKVVRVIPAQQEILPSAALGWNAGGEVATSHQDAAGARAAEPFFELRAIVAPDERVRLLHGRSGRIRIEMHPAPLLEQWYRKLRQLLQRRYQL
jgi:putative peptide zinc metalloprotease protein